ncbi:MAG TPA: TraM recognition domain-containing protein [Solirubrobacteraceae bacterium]|nr:TraM recognition domain-containing protein [Solirubrobacteraceae bacterium]
MPDSARPPQRSSAARRYGGLALWLAVIVSPSVWVAAGLLVAGAALLAVPALLRVAARHAGERAAAAGAGESVTLGRDPGGRTVALSDRQLAAHALIVGASGAGKSTTMLGILGAQIRRGRPVIAIDMKGSPAFAAELEHAAAAAGRRVRIFTPDGPGHWNPLAHGNATALKDKLISTERFSEPHYQRAAERYVQTVLTVLHASEPRPPARPALPAPPAPAARLDRVVALMEPRRLAASLRGVPEPLAERVLDYLSGLTGDQVSAARGLGTRLALLSESCAGPYLVPGGTPGQAIDLRAGLEGGDVILFSLNASVYGKLAAQLGALVIQDLVSASGYRLGGPGSAMAEPAATPIPATVAIDEFSALGDDHVLALLARARESGISVLTATQEMADLQRAAPGFRDQVLGIVGVKIAHRQDVPESAEMIAKMAGTQWVWEETRHVRGLLNPGHGPRASRRQVERFLVHPNEIKTLPVGHAVALTKLPTSQVRRVRVVRAPAPERDGPERG